MQSCHGKGADQAAVFAHRLVTLSAEYAGPLLVRRAHKNSLRRGAPRRCATRIRLLERRLGPTPLLEERRCFFGT